MDKRLIIPGNSEDRRDVYFVREDRPYLMKHASSYHPEISAYIQGAKPLDNLVQVLITALGAGEFWGSNANADFFPEAALRHEGPDYGYKTFETNANYFLHHNNKDPALAKGKVLKAVWNSAAKRVELVIGIDVGLDPEGAAAVDRGESLTFSMGSKVPFDICRICENRAKTRAQYCDHLRYQMNQIDPVTGQQVYAINTLPKFFDISRVLIPADKTAYMWTKIASASNPYRQLGSAQLAELPPGKIADLAYLSKTASDLREAGLEKAGRATKIAVVKDAAITKRVEIQVEPAIEKVVSEDAPLAKGFLQHVSPTLGVDALARMCGPGIGLGEILSSFSSLYMEPKEEELSWLISRLKPSEADISTLELGPEKVKTQVLIELKPHIQERSFSNPHLLRRLVLTANGLDKGSPVLLKAANQYMAFSEGYPVMPQLPVAHAMLQAPGSGQPRGGNPKTAPKSNANQLYMAGVLAALYVLLRRYASPKSILQNTLATSLLAGAVGSVAAGLAPLLEDPKKKPANGFYDVDPTLNGLYNRPWQSRFADMQARPVAVIKTASTGPAHKSFMRTVAVGTPLIFAASEVAKAGQAGPNGGSSGIVSKIVAEEPGALTGLLVGGAELRKRMMDRASKITGFGEKLIKNASVRNQEFLDIVPEQERELIWELAGLDATQRIAKKLSEG